MSDKNDIGWGAFMHAAEGGYNHLGAMTITLPAKIRQPSPQNPELKRQRPVR
jgi:hypothetical protein